MAYGGFSNFLFSASNYRLCKFTAVASWLVMGNNKEIGFWVLKSGFKFNGYFYFTDFPDDWGLNWDKAQKDQLVCTWAFYEFIKNLLQSSVEGRNSDHIVDIFMVD